MSFTRLIDDSVLIPFMFFGPYEQVRESRNVVRTLLESSNVRVSYIPATRRGGEFQLVFTTYPEAHAAVDYFTVPSLFQFNGPTEPGTDGTYVIVDGLIVLADGDADAGFSMLFAVDTGRLRVLQNISRWEVRVPYREIQA